MKLEPSIVRVTTDDGLYLHGFFQPGSKQKTVLLYIHGFEGNFYEDSFTDYIAKELKEINTSWLSVNTRGNGQITNFNTTDNNSTRTIGARYELLEDAYMDIDAWIEFLIEYGFTNITLMGHSLGTYKVVRYLFEGKHKDKIKKLILLSPFDKKILLETYAKTPIQELLNQAQNFVSQGKGDDIIAPKFNEIILSYKTYISWYQQDDFGRCFEFCTKDYDFPILRRVIVPTKIIVGSKDEYFYGSNPDHPEEAMNMMLSAIPRSEGVIIAEAVHSFSPHEDKLAKEIEIFLEK